MRSVLTHLVLFVFLAVGSEAVIVAGGDGTQNTTAPAGGQGWDYVGRITSANGAPSGVTYISNNWFITAHHIKELDNPTGVLLGGLPYSIDPNSWIRMTNSVGGVADLSMFRVVGGTVELPGLTVRSAVTLPGSELTMIGNGRNRESGETHWNAFWAETSSSRFAIHSGYKWASGATKRWGTNDLDADVGLFDDGFGITDMFLSDFDDAGGSEAQGATYDSGGGVFFDNDGDWELAGIMVATLGTGNQPDGTAVYGNQTLMADMQFYAAQISSTALILDLDDDGIPDAWEYEQSGSTTGVVATADQDEDGFSGDEEWVADTNPLDGNSFLLLTSFTNGMELIFASSSNRMYQIEQNLNLTNDVWTAATSWIGGSYPVTSVNLPIVDSNLFYRVRAKLP